MNDALELDADAVRTFANEVYTELKNVIEPWAKEVKAQLQGTDGEGDDTDRLGGSDSDPGRTLGSNDADYTGNFVGRWHADNVAAGSDWLDRILMGLESLSMMSVVACEKTLETDDETSSNVDAGRIKLMAPTREGDTD